MCNISEQLTRRYTETNITEMVNTIEVIKPFLYCGIEATAIDMQSERISGIYPDLKDRYLLIKDARIIVFMSQIPALIAELEKILATSGVMSDD